MSSQLQIPKLLPEILTPVPRDVRMTHVVFSRDYTLYTDLLPYNTKDLDFRSKMPLMFYPGKAENVSIVSFVKGNTLVSVSYNIYGKQYDRNYEDIVLNFANKAVLEFPKQVQFHYLFDANGLPIANLITNEKFQKFTWRPMFETSAREPQICYGNDGKLFRIYDSGGVFNFCAASFLSQSLIKPPRVSMDSGAVFANMVHLKYPEYSPSTYIINTEIDDYIIPKCTYHLRMAPVRYNALRAFSLDVRLSEALEHPFSDIPPAQGADEKESEQESGVADMDMPTWPLSMIVKREFPTHKYCIVEMDCMIPELWAFKITMMYWEESYLVILVGDATKDKLPTPSQIERIFGHLGIDVFVEVDGAPLDTGG